MYEINESSDGDDDVDDDVDDDAYDHENDATLEDDDALGNLVTQEASFSQRLPLLKQMSTDTIRTQNTSATRFATTLNDIPHNESSDDVSLYHNGIQGIRHLNI